MAAIQIIDSGFSRPTEDDLRGWLWVVTILSIIYSLTLLGARLFVKYGQLGRDDVVLGLAYVVAIARWGAIMGAFRLGLGAYGDGDINESSAAPTLAQLAFWSRTLFLIAHWSAKASVAVFTRRLFSGNMRHEALIFATTFGCVGVSGLAAVLISCIGCRAIAFVAGSETSACSGESTRWVAVCVLDAISEAILLATPAVLLSSLQMQWAKKRKVWLYYSFRIGVIILSAVQTSSYLEYLRNGRPSIGLGRPLILQELLLCYSLISATIPCMRTFVGAFAGHNLMLTDPTAATYGSHDQGNSYQLRTIGSGKTTLQTSAGVDAVHRDRIHLRPDPMSYNVSVEHRQGSRSLERMSSESDRSDRMIIRRDTHVYVERDG